MTANRIPLSELERGIPFEQRYERAAELLTSVGMRDRTAFRPSQLSGGQRQRVAVARAVANSPSVILADEPTGNLDTQTGVDILRLVSDLHVQLGSTVLIVTHDMNVAAICQRTVTIRDGRIVADVRNS